MDGGAPGGVAGERTTGFLIFLHISFEKLLLSNVLQNMGEFPASSLSVSLFLALSLDRRHFMGEIYDPVCDSCIFV